LVLIGRPLAKHLNKLSKYDIAVGLLAGGLALRSGSTIANEVYPRRGYC